MNLTFAGNITFRAKGGVARLDRRRRLPTLEGAAGGREPSTTNAGGFKMF